MSALTFSFSRRRSADAKFNNEHRRPVGIGVTAAAVFLIVAGFGLASSYWGNAPEPTGSSRSPAQDDALARLKDYTRTIALEHQAPAPTTGKMLPDVSTMIEKLAARLEAAPDDIKGWQMLGWSYFHTEHYAQAASAYAKAMTLDPNSTELKQAYEDAKAKVSGKDRSEAAVSAVAKSTPGDEKHRDGAASKDLATHDAVSPDETNAAIRAMVDGLSDRLERSPRDIEGWTRLIRSRVVLGERDVAAAAFRKALDVFKDDVAATTSIKAAADEFGLRPE
jgi:cytochrome c-type biogenesis protein CcmH/NrfG